MDVGVDTHLILAIDSLDNDVTSEKHPSVVHLDSLHLLDVQREHATLCGGNRLPVQVI